MQIQYLPMVLSPWTTNLAAIDSEELRVSLFQTGRISSWRIIQNKYYYWGVISNQLVHRYFKITTYLLFNQVYWRHKLVHHFVTLFLQPLTPTIRNRFNKKTCTLCIGKMRSILIYTATSNSYLGHEIFILSIPCSQGRVRTVYHITFINMDEATSEV